MKRIYDTVLVLFLGLAMMACTTDSTLEPQEDGPQGPETENPETGKPETPDEPDSPQPQVCYVPVVADKEDWSGDYLIASTSEGGEVVFAKWKKYGRPAAGVDLLKLKDKEGRIPAAVVDDYRSVITRCGDKYSILVPNVGYLGVEKRHNITYIQDVPVADRFHWTLSYDMEAGVPVISNYESEGMQLLWNNAPDCLWFGTYSSSHDDILDLILYERVEVCLTTEK